MPEMNLDDLWGKALAKTEIVRLRMAGLPPTQAERLPYLFLAESAVNSGDTVVRRGEVTVGKPTLILPHHLPQFEGFEFEENMNFNQDTVLNFLLVRGVSFPSMRYNNKVSSVDVFEGGLRKALKHFGELLERREDTSATLLMGPEDAWQFSVMIFIGALASRSADRDIRVILEEWKRRSRLS